jgi:hypothetical protein
MILKVLVYDKMYWSRALLHTVTGADDTYGQTITIAIASKWTLERVCPMPPKPNGLAR